MTGTDKKNKLPVQTQRIVNGINLMFAGISEILSAMEPDMAKAVQALAKAAPGNLDDYEEILGADDLPEETEAGQTADHTPATAPESEQESDPPKKKAAPKKKQEQTAQTALTADDLILYISDCHFYHDNLCRNLDHRGFIDFEEMNAFMIRQWNDNVNPKDDVYILGDFCFGNGEAAARIIKQLKGRLHLIIGNHDRFLHDRHFNRGLFKSIEVYSEISDKGRTVILSHYPVFCYKGQYRRNVDGSPATYMLYGHVHNTQDERLVNRFIMQTRATAVKPRNAGRPEPIPCNMINCFCMFSNYTPLTLDEWIDVDRERRDAMVGSGINTEV